MIIEFVDIIERAPSHSWASKQSNWSNIPSISNHLKNDSLESMILCLETIAIIIDISSLHLLLHVLFSKQGINSTELCLGSNDLSAFLINFKEVFLFIFHTLLRQRRISLYSLVHWWWHGFIMFLFILFLSFLRFDLSLIMCFIQVLSVLLWITLFFDESWLVSYHCIILNLLWVSR